MNKKREIRKKRILLCKGAGLNESANAMQDLLDRAAATDETDPTAD